MILSKCIVILDKRIIVAAIKLLINVRKLNLIIIYEIFRYAFIKVYEKNKLNVKNQSIQELFLKK
jgi:hypothetical protein